MRAKVRYLTGLWSFLRHKVSAGEARAIVVQSLARREENFLRLVKFGIYGKDDSPFRKLLIHAGVDFVEFRRRVQEEGLELALKRLYSEGVYITYNEMRGREPVRREGLEFQIDESGLDNPLLEAQYELTSSGSTGNAGSRSFTDLTLLGHEAAHYRVHFEAQGVPESSPVVVWGPVPPTLLGLAGCVRFAKIGRIAAWFSPTRFPGGRQGLRGRALVAYTILVSILAGNRIPWPQYVPAEDSLTIAHTLAKLCRQGKAPAIQITASAATRVCLAARENRLDLTGTSMRVGGEPYTEAKAAVIKASGAKAFPGYHASELGLAGQGCATPNAPLDDLHLVTDKFLVYARDKAINTAGDTVPALVYTTLHPNCRKIMLNAESGDYGTLEERACGCLIGDLGFRTHLTGLHGYDKMTSEGVTFMGSDLFQLVEQVLPAAFGGSTTDYQLAEEEDDQGLPKVSIVIAPAVGVVDEDAVIATVLKSLQVLDGPDRGPVMAERWRQSQTLRVVRREPFIAGGRKVLPLHLISRTQQEVDQSPPV